MRHLGVQPLTGEQRTLPDRESLILVVGRARGTGAGGESLVQGRNSRTRTLCDQPELTMWCRGCQMSCSPTERRSRTGQEEWATRASRRAVNLASNRRRAVLLTAVLRRPQRATRGNEDLRSRDSWAAPGVSVKGGAETRGGGHPARLLASDRRRGAASRTAYQRPWIGVHRNEPAGPQSQRSARQIPPAITGAPVTPRQSVEGPLVSTAARGFRGRTTPPRASKAGGLPEIPDRPTNVTPATSVPGGS